MTDNIIAFLKDDANISLLWWCFVGGLIVILVLKSLLKATKIKPKVFDNIILYASILFLILAVSNIIMSQNYGRLWNVILVFALIILQGVMPKLMKWYDGKIDNLGEKISTTSKRK